MRLVVIERVNLCNHDLSVLERAVNQLLEEGWHVKDGLLLSTQYEPLQQMVRYNQDPLEITTSYRLCERDPEKLNYDIEPGYARYHDPLIIDGKAIFAIEKRAKVYQRYELLASANEEDLSDQVSSFLREGWEPYEMPVIGEAGYGQAITRTVVEAIPIIEK